MCADKWVKWSRFAEAYKYSDTQDLSIGRHVPELAQFFGKDAVEGRWGTWSGSFAQVPGNVCVQVVTGYFYRGGVLPCIGTKARIGVPVDRKRDSSTTKSQLESNGLVAQHGYRLLSLLPEIGNSYSDSDYFAFTHGLSKLALLYPLFRATTSSKFLAYSGTMVSLLGMLGVEDYRIVQPPDDGRNRNRNNLFHYSAEITTVLHDHHINNTKILLPANTLSDIRETVIRAVQWSIPESAKKAQTARPSIVYIQRSLDGEHPVLYRQKRLLAMIKRVISPQYDLVVLGGAACPKPSNADTNWINTANIFLHAIGVIAVTDKHGVGFCDSDGLLAQAAFLTDSKKTTFIEILHDSSLKRSQATGDGGASSSSLPLRGDVEVNNILFAKGKTGGNRHWLVPSKLVGLANNARFSAKVNPKDVLQILAEEGLASYEHALFDQLHFNTSVHENKKKNAQAKFNKQNKSTQKYSVQL
jgi:hypothetical protein